MFCSLGLYGPSLVASVLYLSAIAQVGGFFFVVFLVLVAGSMVDRSVVIEAPFHINEFSHFSRKEMAAIA